MKFTHRGSECVSNAFRVGQSWSVDIRRLPKNSETAPLLGECFVDGSLEKGNAETEGIRIFLEMVRQESAT